jgi:predicted O-methyltransferase YrrM
MNDVLKEILRSNRVTDASFDMPLPSVTSMNEEEGEVIFKAFSIVKPDVSLEVGFAYGISTLYACDALAQNQRESRHIIIDPNQSTDWHGIGLKNVTRAGYGHFIELHEEKSEIALPNLLSKGTTIQAAVIDGWHTFDHTLVDFFYINKMLDVGGIVILDDANWPAIQRLTYHIATYPAYEVFMKTGIAHTPAEADLLAALRTKVRRMLAKATNMPVFKRHWDYPAPSCIAYRKIKPDNRNFNWHVDF